MKFLLCFKAVCFCRFSCNFFLLVASGMKNRNTLTASPNKRLVSNVDSGDLRTASRFRLVLDSVPNILLGLPAGRLFKLQENIPPGGQGSQGRREELLPVEGADFQV